MRIYKNPVRRIVRGRRVAHFSCRVYDTETGRRSWRSTGKTSRDAALAHMRLWEFEDSQPPKKKDEKLTLAATLDQWLEEKRGHMTHRGFEAYRGRVARVKANLPGGIRLAAVERQHLERHLRRRSSEIGPSTLNKERRMLRQFFNWCIDQEWIDGNPAAKLPRRVEPKRQIRVLSPEEEARLLETCRTPHKLTCVGRRNAGGRKGGAKTSRRCSWTQEKSRPSWLYPVVFVALRTGLRYGSIEKLEWIDVDWKSKALRLSPSKLKAREGLTVPLDDQTVDLLRSLHLGSSSMKVFELPDAGDVRRAFQRATSDAGIRACRFHDLRATFITRCREAGVDLEVTAKLVGHRDVKTTLKFYRAIGEDELREAIVKKCSLVSRRTETGA